MKDIQPQERSIRNITVRHKHERPAPPEPPRAPRRPRRSRRLWWLALIVVVIAAALGLLLSTVFAGATVTVTPRTASVTLPATLPAGLNAPVGTLSYQILSVSQSATTTAPASGTQQVQKQASGTITISNAYTSAPQTLINTTRFEAPDGKIYRIHSAVTVPGLSGGKPGTVSVTAYADAAGADYNRTGTTSYTIPGFNGDPRFTKITASSGPMTGGFTGTQPVVAAADLQSATQQLNQQLNASVLAALASNVPEGYELIPGTSNVSYSGLSQSAGNTASTAALSETATANAAMLRINDLAAAVAAQTVTGYQGEAVTFADPSSVTLSASTTPQAQSLTLQLSGSASLVWVFDPNALKAALVGKQKGQFETIIQSFEPAITSADAGIRPFWAGTFPSDPGKITVTAAK